MAARRSRKTNSGGTQHPSKWEAEPRLTIRIMEPTDWPIIERLFGGNGACGGCWCMSWRVSKHGKSWEEAKGEKNRASFRELVELGQVHAVLALVGDEPVGWCSFGPRGTFPRLVRARALQREWSEGTWSVVCFFIRSAWRRRGVGTSLLAAATARALALGACEVEGFPAVPWEAGVAIPAAFAWTGVPAQFEAVGYQELERAGAKRPIYVKHP